MVMGRALSLALVLGLAAGCGGGGSGGGFPTVSVTIVYLAATERDPDIPDCGVGATHIHPSWRDFARVGLVANGPDEWWIEFTDVPPNRLLSIRVNDANKCPADPNGATTEDIYANGVLLTNVVDTPGDGIEPGLSFSVDADGEVTP